MATEQGETERDEENPAVSESAPLINREGQEGQEGLLDKSAIKRDFIIKVYAILATQIALTAGLVAFCTFYAPVGDVAEGMFFAWEPNFKTFLISLIYYIPCIGVLVCLFFKGDDYPLNFFLLFIFTILMSFPIGGACHQMYRTGQGFSIVIAVGITALTFATISLMVVCIKFEDEKMFLLWIFLYTILLVNGLVGLFAFIFGWSGLMFAYNVMGVIIFSGYILFDTWVILQSDLINVEAGNITTGVAVFCAIKLYLDIINLFMHILSLMRRR
jgi:FtsH-binding integral membrane protein